MINNPIWQSQSNSQSDPRSLLIRRPHGVIRLANIGLGAQKYEVGAAYQQDVGTSVTRISQKQLHLLERLYIFSHRTEVLSFLEHHPFLMSLLIEGYTFIQTYFPHVRVSLHVISDPDEASSTQLAVHIATDLAPEVAVHQLQQFDAGWWFDNLARARNKMLINIVAA